MKLHSTEIDNCQIRHEDCFKYLQRKMSIISTGFLTGTKTSLQNSPPGFIPVLRYSSYQNMTPFLLRFKRNMTVYFHIPHLWYGIFNCSENNYQGLFLWDSKITCQCRLHSKGISYGWKMKARKAAARRWQQTNWSSAQMFDSLRKAAPPSCSLSIRL